MFHKSTLESNHILLIIKFKICVVEKILHIDGMLIVGTVLSGLSLCGPYPFRPGFATEEPKSVPDERSPSVAIAQHSLDFRPATAGSNLQ